MLVGLLVSRHKLRCLFKGIALLVLDAVLTVLSSAASFCVGHAEHVIGFHAAVSATVAGDGVSELKSFLHIGLNAVEDVVCFVASLGRGLSLDRVLFAVAEELLAVSFELLVGDDGVSFIQVATVEFLDGGCRDGLLQVNNWS